MTKLDRKLQKIFAGGIPYSNVIAKFGSLKNGLPLYSDNPDVIQELPAFSDGFSNAVIGGYTPAIQDINALYYLTTRQIAYLMQEGIPEWTSTRTYYIGSIVQDGSGNIYRSLVDNNLNNAFTDSSKWFAVHNISVTNIGSAYTALNTDYYIRWSTADTSSTPSLRTITLPEPNANLIGKEFIIKNTSGSSYPVVIKASNDVYFNTYAPTLSLSQYKYCKVICDGTNWWTLTNVFP